jgi:hypothetical protein
MYKLFKNTPDNLKLEQVILKKKFEQNSVLIKINYSI